MISNQILQNTIDGLKNIARVEFCIMDVDGKEVASTADMGSRASAVAEFAASVADSQEIQGYQFFKIFDDLDAVTEEWAAYVRCIRELMAFLQERQIETVAACDFEQELV